MDTNILHKYSMKLFELKHSIEFGKEFGPTDKFSKMYGNFCGAGNCGGLPIDAVDKACRDHDECYHYKGRDDCGCDEKFIEQLNKLLGEKLSLRARLAATAMKLYFKNKCRHSVYGIS